MVNYTFYQGRPCGSTARQVNRWNRIDLQKEAIRLGVDHHGTLDELCARLTSRSSSYQRRVQKGGKRPQTQFLKRETPDQLQLSRLKHPKSSTVSEGVMWALSYLGIYNTLFWSMPGERRNDTYQYRCDRKCHIPDDETLAKLLGSKVFHISYFRQKHNENPLPEDLSLGIDDCQVLSRSYMPKSCLRHWDVDAIFENLHDHQDYQWVDRTRCPSDCNILDQDEVGTSNIYHKLGTNEYYILFMTGSIMAGSELSKLLGAMIFVNSTLVNYLGKGFRIIIGGHSAGSVNAIYVARVLSMLDRQFQLMIETLPNCSEEPALHPYYEDSSVSPQSRSPWYDDPVALCKDASSISPDDFQNGSPEIRGVLHTDHRRIRPVNLKYLTSQVIRCQDIVRQFRQECREVIFMTSGGHPCIEGIIPWSQTEHFYRYRIINFGIIQIVFAVNMVFGDKFISTPEMNYQAIPVIGIYNIPDKQSLELISDPINLAPQHPEIIWNKLAHDFMFYRQNLLELLKNPQQQARFNSYFLKESVV